MVLVLVSALSLASISDAPRSAHLVDEVARAEAAAQLAQAPAPGGEVNARRYAIKTRLIQLDREIGGIESDGWGAVNVALAATGIVLSLAIFPGLGLLLGGLVFYDTVALVVGILLTLVGVGGIVLTIIASLNGTKNSFEAKERKGKLNKERRELLEELNELDSGGAAPPPPPPPPAAFVAPGRWMVVAQF